jgi:Tn3 transposase DDE domain
MWDQQQDQSEQLPRDQIYEPQSLSGDHALITWRTHHRCSAAGAAFWNPTAIRSARKDQLGALGLVLNCGTFWNTVYLDRAFAELRAQGYPVLDEDVARLSAYLRNTSTSTATTRSGCPTWSGPGARCATPATPTRTTTGPDALLPGRPPPTPNSPNSTPPATGRYVGHPRRPRSHLINPCQKPILHRDGG